jgi:hypothetical protein
MNAKVKRWKPSKEASSHCDGRVEECFCDQLDGHGDCVDCGSTQHEREAGGPIELDRPDVIEDAIEVLAVELLDRVKMIAGSVEDRGVGLERKLGALVRAGRPFSDVMQMFAGFLTEHTMTIEVVEASALTIGNGIKLQDSKAALIERNGGNGS